MSVFCVDNMFAPRARKERSYMDDFIVSGEYKGYVYVGHAQGNSEQERKDPTTGELVTVKVPYYNMYILQPVSDYVSADYQAVGFKAEKIKCISADVWDGLVPGEQVKIFFDDKKRAQMAVSEAAMAASKAAAVKHKDEKSTT